MNYKDETILLIKELQKLGLNRRDIEEKLDYSPFYLDTNLSKGGNKKVVSALTRLLEKERLTDSETATPYIKHRHNLKNNQKDNDLMYYEIGANAGTAHSAEILPVKKNEGVLHINDLFRGSQYAIRISGNSMTPNYPSGAIIGIREIPDKQITPGSVYIIEKDNDLWIKRMFYKNDDQSSGIFECVSDNTMKYESGTGREGRLYYPPFYINIDEVRKLFKVTGIYKPNELTVIN